MAAAFIRLDGRSGKLKQIDCPQSVATTYLSRAGRWRLPTLVGITETPTLRRDGTMLDQPGYDAESGLLFEPGGTVFSNILNEPSRLDGLANLELLQDVVKDFPFKTVADEAVAVAAILTALVRPALRSAPLFGFSAPDMGSGKSLLADCVARITTGRDAPAMSQGRNRDEDQKVLLSLLIAGDPIILLDNCERPIQGDALATILTQTAYRGRLLGSNESVTVPTNVTFLATGNNLSFKDDTTTRALVCEIDPLVEKPEEREFDRDLRPYVRAHRTELVCAGLTVLRSYVAAGCPSVDLKPFGRFEQWSDLIRSALVWLDLPDPCTTRAKIIANDPVRTELANLLVAWDAIYGDQKVTAQAVMGRVSNCPDSDEVGKALANAIHAAIPDPTTRRLGLYLRHREGRIVAKLRIERAGSHQRSVEWRCAKEGEFSEFGEDLYQPP